MILAMFPSTTRIIKVEQIISYLDPLTIGNKAIYFLVASRVDEYFQCAIKNFTGYGDRALRFLQQQCTNIEESDKHHYNLLFIITMNQG